ncbi:MAG: hypothetical protein AAF960_12660 [Bacteroidota bacterium]
MSVHPKAIYIFLLATIGWTTTLTAQLTSPNQERHSFFLSLGTIKSMYYNSSIKQAHEMGFLSFQAGYGLKVADQRKLVLNVGLMRKGPFGFCQEFCEFESTFSLPIKMRLETTILNGKMTYGTGAGLTMYVLNRDDMYNDDFTVIEIPAVYERQFGLGLDLVTYYNAQTNVKIGINYNPNLYEVTEGRLKYYHTLFLEFRYDIL